MKNNRQPNRLKQYDYSQNGAYFITVSTKDYKCILCNIVRDGAPDVPYAKLSTYGKIVNDEIIKSNDIYDYIKVEKYVIMPNHIHMILVVDKDEQGTSRAPSRTNEIIPAFVSMLKRFTNKKCGEQIWHRSFHDHIIRDQRDYGRIYKYIEENPLKWNEDCYYTE